MQPDENEDNNNFENKQEFDEPKNNNNNSLYSQSFGYDNSSLKSQNSRYSRQPSSIARSNKRFQKYKSKSRNNFNLEEPEKRSLYTIDDVSGSNNTNSNVTGRNIIDNGENGEYNDDGFSERNYAQQIKNLGMKSVSIVSNLDKIINLVRIIN